MLNCEQRPFAKNRKRMHNWMPDGQMEYVTCIEHYLRGSQNRMEYDRIGRYLLRILLDVRRRF